MPKNNDKQGFTYRAVAAAVIIGLGQYPIQAIAGKEFRINPEGQALVSTGGKRVASDAQGNFVAVWAGDAGLALRLYTAAGKPKGSPILVPNTDTAENASVAMKGDGQFVVAWHGNNLVNAQIFDAAGAAKGGTVRVTSLASQAEEQPPAVAMDAAGDFVVAWKDGRNLMARTFDPAGNSRAESVVESVSDGMDGLSVAMDSQGDFVVAWSDGGIYFRRFGAGGQALGDATEADTTTNSYDEDLTAEATAPSVAMDAAGDFVVAWTETEQRSASKTKTVKGKCSSYTDDYGDTYRYCYDDSYVTTTTVSTKATVRARRYTKSAGSLGPQIVVAKAKSQYSYNPDTGEGSVPPGKAYRKTDVAMDAAGNFAVGWQSDRTKIVKGRCTSYKDEYGYKYTYCGEDSYSTKSDIEARKYKANTKPKGVALLAAKGSAAAPANTDPSVALSGHKDLALIWNRPTEDGADLFGRAYPAKAK